MLIISQIRNISVNSIVSTYLYIDYYSIIWINDYLCCFSFYQSEAKMMATKKRHPTHCASRVARSKSVSGPRVPSVLQQNIKWPLCYFGRCTFLHAIYIYFSCIIVSSGKRNHNSFVYYIITLVRVAPATITP